MHSNLQHGTNGYWPATAASGADVAHSPQGVKVYDGSGCLIEQLLMQRLELVHRNVVLCDNRLERPRPGLLLMVPLKAGD